MTGFPAVLRPAFTLGGSGGGIAYNIDEFNTIITRGLDLSPISQVLIEESILGWKEFELEVVRDLDDNVEIICSIENFDPMGVHTGDSITVAPILTLTDPDYQRMREASKAIIRAVGVETGGSNIQFALHPIDGRMIVSEMNPRVSRSSALASKATGFPIAWVATKLALGYRLWELPNVITQKTKAAFEPVLDYVVVKIPRFTFEKFPTAEKILGTQMKSVGEVMAIGRTFKEALQKAVRSLEEGHPGLAGALDGKLDLDHLRQFLMVPGPQRLFWIYQALKVGQSVEEIHRLTSITPWFIQEIEEIVILEGRLRGYPAHLIPQDMLEQAKRAGFSDQQIARFTGGSEEEVKELRHRYGIHPAFKRVDTCAGEFVAETPYLYGTWEDHSDAEPTDRPKA
ncbi:MAG: carbamoyl phosphate synthase large subunit, partial [Holophagaceae bacterium]